MFTKKQIKFWDDLIFPIYSKAEEPFREWVEHAIPKVRTNKFSSFPLSDITFSIINKHTVNPSRFAIGIFEPSYEDIKKFNKSVKALCRTRIRFLSYPYLIGLGEDLLANEYKVYIYKRTHGQVIIIAYTYKDGHLIEKKKYYPFSKGYLGYGERGKRTQIDLGLEDDEAIRYIKKLPIPALSKRLAIKVIKSGLFSLDTVSFSKERGIALYFD